MTTYIEHAADGRIYWVSECDEAPPASFGGTVVGLAARIDVNRSLYIDGAIVELEPQPGPMYVIDPASHTWVAPGLTPVQTAQDEKWAEIKRERDRREQTVFPYLGHWLQSDSVSVLRMVGAERKALTAQAAGEPFDIIWTAADNTQVPMDAATVVGMLPALAVWSNTLHTIGRHLRDQIYSVPVPWVPFDTQIERIKSITWPADAQIE